MSKPDSKIISFFESFLLNSSPQYVALHIIPKEDRKRIIRLLNKWRQENYVSEQVILNILENAIQTFYDDGSGNGEQFNQIFINCLRQLLVDIATKKRLHINFFISYYKNNKWLECSALIYALKNYSANLDYNKIECNLNKLFGLNKIIKAGWASKMRIEESRARWIEKMKADNGHTNNLLQFLNKDNSPYLSDIDETLRGLIELNEQSEEPIFSNETMGIHLLNDTQTGDTLSEIKLIGMLRKRSFDIIKLDVKVGQHPTDTNNNQKDFDMLVGIGDTELYIETTRPLEDYDLRLFGPQYAKNSLPEMETAIAKKYKKFCELESNQTAILAIDNNLLCVPKQSIRKIINVKKFKRIQAVLLFDESFCLITNDCARPLPDVFCEKLHDA